MKLECKNYRTGNIFLVSEIQENHLSPANCYLKPCVPIMDCDYGFDEYDVFESEHADEFDILDELEGRSEPPNARPSAPVECTIELPDISQSTAPKKRRLFSPDENEDLPPNFLDPDASLVIDEDFGEQSPKRKRTLPNGNVEQNVRKLNLPTTLDVDRDLKLQKLEELKHKNNISTPQILEKIRRFKENKNNAKEFLTKDTVQTGARRGLQFQLTKVLVHPPVHSDFMSATSSDGQRVYMRIKSSKRNEVSSTTELLGNSHSSRLLPQTMTELRQIIFEQKKYDVVEESKKITDEIRRAALAGSSIPDSSMEEDVDEGVYSGDDNSTDGLWVNKYAPTHYTHLLSDESVNRALLRWLKLWDKVVFGRDYQPRKAKIPEQQSKQQKFKSKFAKSYNADSTEEELDDTKRPKMKAALLCGPPGLGKTTLAHIIAKHAGYHIVEMNASDDRSAEVFKKKLEQTTQMKSVLGSDHKPNCLIIDEIDGAPQAAINVLLNAMNKTRKDEGKKKKPRKEVGGILQRPIICICNDLYVPALRQLRQQSYVLQFPQTTSSRLASRLKQMCFSQRLQCEMSSLFALCEKSGNDIRACINTLQFVQSKGENRLSTDMIKNLSIGQKDQHKSVFYVWNEIFQQPKNKRKMDMDSQTLQQSLSDVHKLSQFSARFYHIHSTVTANGEYEKTLRGVFDNFLLMKYKDSGMQALNKGCEWLLLHDQLSLETMSHQEWILMSYTPYLFVSFHLLFSCLTPPRILFPQKTHENRQKLQKSVNLLSSMYGDMSPTTRCFTSPNVAILDTVPYLMAIMMPNLRPVNMQLYSPAERKQLSDLVSSMLAYNLTYRQERNQEGQYTYILEPNMCDVCHFVEEGSGARKQLSYAVKQIISKEVEMERMRRSERLLTDKEDRPEKENSAKKAAKEKKSTGKELPNHLQRLTTNMNTVAVPADKPVRNFFSKFTKVKRVDENGVTKPSKKSVEVKDPGIGNSQLWYKYNEGFSNAVRRKVYVKDFL
ncbi:unnamed protein product [Clavelina lepadiformis]|uniref:AAA+ ATPase domain-containing protein n=1 Tax=Clavelina lepadiformis TaxID=159417 RepID=A0ABP0GW79_CLALP